MSLLSCFRKKKSKDKKKDKKNAPSAPPPSMVSAAVPEDKPTITVENGDTNNHRPGEDKNFQDSNEALSDFSAVRETEVLKSGSNNDLFEGGKTCEDEADNVSSNVTKERVEVDVGGYEKEVKNKESEKLSLEKSNDTEDTRKDELEISMLDEINNTLASIHSSETPSAAENEKKKEEKPLKPEIVEEKVVRDVEVKIESSVTEVVKENKSDVKNDVAGVVSHVDVEVNVEEETKLTDSKEDKSANEEDDEEEEQVITETFEVNVQELKNQIVEEKEKTNEIEEKVDAVIEAEVKEVQDDDLKIVESLDDNKVCVTENEQTEPETVEELQKNIPPKVSPKPSHKLEVKTVPSAEINGEQIHSEDEPPTSLTVEPLADEKVNGHSDHNGSLEEEMENNNTSESPPTSPTQMPTTPTSPTTPSSKGQSRIPMSKKPSGIPKLNFAKQSPAPASPSAKSPVSVTPTSPTTSTDLKKNHSNPSSPTSDLDSEAQSATSPFNKENRNSKTKLTKLRYSGRKKSSESKSDESGSDRGSRAGSEAKSDDGKKAAEDAEQEKNSRIPVRGGSKSRASPPKSLGH